MAVRLTYIAIAIGGACGALAALVGSPSASTETSPPLEGMNGLPMRPIGQIATGEHPGLAQASATAASLAPVSSPSASAEPVSLPVETATAIAPVAPAAASSAVPPSEGAAASPVAASLASWDTEPPPSDKESLLHTEMRCDQKDAPSCILAARAYEDATAGVTDAAKAEKYRKIALTLWISQCDHNSAASCATLADMYRAGRGVPQNEKTASALIARTRELCRYNDAPACHTLPPQ